MSARLILKKFEAFNSTNSTSSATPTCVIMPDQTTTRKTAARRYSLESQVKSVLNSEKLSDVSFLVGEQRVLVRGHKAILALGSEIFETMLFGSLKMATDRPIEIPDLMPTGFLNAVRYIYGHRVDEFDLADYYVSYLAGDKYLVHGMTESMLECAKEKLNEKNCCMIYDQLLKIEKHEQVAVLKEVRDLIMSNSRIAFENEHFVRIDLHTLIDLLQLDQLNIAEIEVLKCCSKWLNWRIAQAGMPATLANKRAAFAPIKRLIRFTDMMPDEVGAFKEIENLLEPAELLSLFLHLFDKARPLTIEYESPRVKCVYSVHGLSHSLSHYGCTRDQLIVTLSVSKRIRISSIHTLLPTEIGEDLKLRIQQADGKPFSLDYDLLPVDRKWCIKLKNAFEVDPASVYRLTFAFQPFYFNPSCLLSHQVKMVHESSYESICFHFLLTNNCVHCVHGIDFCI